MKEFVKKNIDSVEIAVLDAQSKIQAVTLKELCDQDILIRALSKHHIERIKDKTAEKYKKSPYDTKLSEIVFGDCPYNFQNETGTSQRLEAGRDWFAQQIYNQVLQRVIPDSETMRSCDEYLWATGSLMGAMNNVIKGCEQILSPRQKGDEYLRMALYSALLGYYYFQEKLNKGYRIAGNKKPIINPIDTLLEEEIQAVAQELNQQKVDFSPASKKILADLMPSQNSSGAFLLSNNEDLNKKRADLKIVYNEYLTLFAASKPTVKAPQNK